MNDLLEKAKQEIDDRADAINFVRGIAIGTVFGAIGWGIFFWLIRG